MSACAAAYVLIALADVVLGLLLEADAAVRPSVRNVPQCDDKRQGQQRCRCVKRHNAGDRCNFIRLCLSGFYDPATRRFETEHVRTVASVVLICRKSLRT